MNDENRISVVINTRNAEQHLQQVLEAVKGFDDIRVPSLRVLSPSPRPVIPGCSWWMPMRS